MASCGYLLSTPQLLTALQSPRIGTLMKLRLRRSARVLAQQFFALVLLVLAACGKREERSNVRAGPSQAVTPQADTQQVKGQMWVTAQRAQRRTCASERCGFLGQLFFRESAIVKERSNGWARVSAPYDASCVNGSSEYIKRGNKACNPQNGIVDGQFSEWVQVSDLSETRPPDPVEMAAANERFLAQSDDYAQHRAAFLKAADSLITAGRCTEKDFEDFGGWTKSIAQRDEPIYFMYCGAMDLPNRIYLDASSGRIFK